ncbi:mitochondrial proton/calcium exchanger protein-like protein [Tanacetum coccineum]
MDLNNRIRELEETVKKLRIKVNQMKNFRRVKRKTQGQRALMKVMLRKRKIIGARGWSNDAVSWLKKPSSPPVFQDDHFFGPESTSFIGRNLSNSAAAASTLSSPLKKTAEDLDDFLGKVMTGGSVANDKVLGFAKLFNDELTLDNISRAFTVSGKLKPEEVVRATLSSLPDEVVDTVGITSFPSEDSVSEWQRKLEFLETQEELIKEEEEKEEEEQANKKQSVDSNKYVELEEMINATAADAQQEAKAIALDKQEQL